MQKEQKIKTIIVTHQDRFVRFGYDWFEKLCMKFHTNIVIVNHEELSPQEELLQVIWTSQVPKTNRRG